MKSPMVDRESLGHETKWTKFVIRPVEITQTSLLPFFPLPPPLTPFPLPPFSVFDGTWFRSEVSSLTFPLFPGSQS